ncbi:hypothetical protein ACF0H5_011782 [Mactra antiquata]
MSLSAQERKDVWQDHRESLTRIKTQLSDRQSKALTPTRSPVGRKSGHSPYGKYRQSTPPYLPRLETPPDQRKKASNLRGNKYGIVPPVGARHDSRNTDYDSWGEESDDEPEVDPGHYMPYPHQYSHPPQVVFGAPFPVYYPPPPPPVARKRRRKTENDYKTQPTRQKSPVDDFRQPLAERYEDVNRSVPSKAAKRKQSKRVNFSHPPPPAMNGYVGYPGYPTIMMPTYYSPEMYGGDARSNKYKYIQPRDTPYSPNDQDVYSRFKDEPPSTVDNLFVRVRDDILNEDLKLITHDVVRTTLTELVDEYMLYSQTESDPLESFLTRLLNDAVHEAAGDVVKETVRELARDYVDLKHQEVVFGDLFEDYMDEIGPGLIEDAVFEIIAEEFIKYEVIESELEEEIPEIAKSVLSHYDTKVMKRELKEVSSQAGDKLMESIMIDYLLTLLARQGNVWTESDHANKFMDDMISSVLLDKMFNVTVHRRKTVKNKPTKKLHEKLATDIALDVCLQQLTASLDEDLLDVDEYEHGITDEYSRYNTPASTAFIL